MEISGPTLGIFYISKIFGLAPFALRQNAKGWLEIRRSILFSIFSTSLILIMVALTYRGLLFDANSKIPVRIKLRLSTDNLTTAVAFPFLPERASFRMKSATSKVVTALDVSVVVLATTAGVICGLLGVNSTKELNRRLRKVDETLHTFANEKKDRVRTFIMVLVPMTAITTLLGLDIWTWLRFADQMSNGIENADLNVQWYIPFYSLYYILTGLQISFANTAFGLGRRYRRLNLMLRSSFLGQGDIKYDLVLKQNTTKIKTIFPLTLNASMVKASSDSNVQYDGAAAKKQSRLLQGLAEHHASLCNCVFIVSSSYGVAVLFILVSCLLHLVATSYFLFLEFLNTKDNGYLWLQILWICFHTFRLLMVVEPCHLATRESKKSLQIICEIERRTHDPILAEEIKKFWQQLLVSESEFSAMGLCKVNRNILTSFSSAIATYLIILIQFQKSNG